MAEFPIFPLKTDALIADTQHLSTEEFGAYMRLLIAMWRNGAKLPNKPVELARIAGVSGRKWAAMSERVLRPMTGTAEEISQKRLTSTWLDVEEKRQQNAELGRKGALKRWNGHRIANGMANATSQAKPTPSVRHSEPIANQNQIRENPSSSEQEAARARVATSGPEKEGEKASQLTRLLATALPTGALARGSSSVPISDSLKATVQAKGWNK